MIDQILAQSQAGSANGEGFGQYFAKGMEMRQQRDQFAVQSRQAQERLDLMRTAQEAEQQQNSLAVQMNRMRLQQMADLNTAGGELVKAELELAKEPDGYASSKAVDIANSFFSKYPGLRGHEIGQAFMANIQTAFANKRQLAAYAAAQAAVPIDGLVQSKVVKKDATTGATITYEPSQPTFTPDPNKSYKEVVTVGSDGKTTKRYEELPPDAAPVDEKQAREWGWVPLRQDAKTGKPLWGLPSGGMEVSFGEDGKVTSITTGQKSRKSTSDLTIANQTEAQKKSLAADNSFARAKTLYPMLSQKNVGPQGFLRRKYEELAPILYPGVKIGTDSASAALTSSTIFRAGIVQTLRSDSNIGIKELASLHAAIPSAEDFFSSAQSAKAKLAQVLKEAGRTSRDTAKSLGRPTSEVWMTDQEIHDKYLKGEFGVPDSPEAEAKAIELIGKSGWNFIEMIEKELK
jgi:hypothetical protein